MLMPVKLNRMLHVNSGNCRTLGGAAEPGSYGFPFWPGVQSAFSFSLTKNYILTSILLHVRFSSTTFFQFNSIPPTVHSLMFRVALFTSRFHLLRSPSTLQHITSNRGLASIATTRRPRQKNQQELLIESPESADPSAQQTKDNGDQIIMREKSAGKKTKDYRAARRTRFAVPANGNDEVAEYLVKAYEGKHKNKIADQKRISVISKGLCCNYIFSRTDGRVLTVSR